MWTNGLSGRSLWSLPWQFASCAICAVCGLCCLCGCSAEGHQARKDRHCKTNPFRQKVGEKSHLRKPFSARRGQNGGCA